MSEWVQAAIGIGAVVAGVGFFWGQFYKGKLDGKKSSLEVSEASIKVFREQVEGLQSLMKDQKTAHDNEMRALRDEVVRLQTLLEVKDKRLKEYEEIMKGRDPAVLNILNQLVTVATKSDKTLSSVETFMEKITPFLEVLSMRIGTVLPEEVKNK